VRGSAADDTSIAIDEQGFGASCRQINPEQQLHLPY
jgi:hypothetical protein